MRHCESTLAFAFLVTCEGEDYLPLSITCDARHGPHENKYDVRKDTKGKDAARSESGLIVIQADKQCKANACPHLRRDERQALLVGDVGHSREEYDTEERTGVDYHAYELRLDCRVSEALHSAC